jgi:hypothetical protein
LLGSFFFFLLLFSVIGARRQRRRPGLVKYLAVCILARFIGFC